MKMKMNEEQQKAYEKYKTFLESTNNEIVLKALEEVVNGDDDDD